MCGIVGLISKRHNGFYASDLDALQNLLVLDTLRGMDSTGVFSVNRQGNLNMMKIASHPLHLFACKEWEKFRSSAISSGRILIGHNRAATRGAVNSANAHPFHEGNIILVHNGSLRGDHKKLGDREVDSNAIALSINEKGAEETIKQIDGAFALVWWDIEKGKLFAVRNTERPLNIVTADEVVAIVSEPWMAYAALTKASRKVEDTINIPPGKLFEFDMNGNYTSKDVELRREIWQGGTSNRYNNDSHVGNNHAWDDDSAWENYYAGGGSCTPSGTTPPKKEEGEKKTEAQTSSTTPSTKSTQSSGASDDDMPTQIKQMTGGAFADLAGLKRGERVLVRILTCKEEQGTLKMTGTINHPGKPIVDMVLMVNAIRTLGANWTPEMTGKFFGKPWTAKYLGARNTVNGGPSAYCTAIEEPEMVKIHNGEITKIEWEYVKENEVCKECTSMIDDDGMEFTNVVHAAKNQYKVTCPDCVQDKLQGELKNEFEARRAAHHAVQNGESVSDEVAELTVDLARPFGAPTFH